MPRSTKVVCSGCAAEPATCLACRLREGIGHSLCSSLGTSRGRWVEQPIRPRAAAQTDCCRPPEGRNSRGSCTVRFLSAPLIKKSLDIRYCVTTRSSPWRIRRPSLPSGVSAWCVYSRSGGIDNAESETGYDPLGRDVGAKTAHAVAHRVAGRASLLCSTLTIALWSLRWHSAMRRRRPARRWSTAGMCDGAWASAEQMVCRPQRQRGYWSASDTRDWRWGRRWRREPADCDTGDAPGSGRRCWSPDRCP